MDSQNGGVFVFGFKLHIVHFWLHHTAYCGDSVSAERVGQWEEGRVTRRVMYT